MRASPLVSIVIPCYNQGRFLGEAIESAQRQTHPHVEVIVVDDGSTDETARVASKHGAARYLRQRNGGAAVARTAGLRESRGEFLIFLDADDRLLPAAVATGVEHLAIQPASAFVTGHVCLIAEDGSASGVPPQAHAETDYVALLRSNYIWTPGAVMYRRSVFDAVGAFDPSARGSADYDLNIRIARQFPFGCHHQVILEYRQHTANMSGDAAHMLRSAVSVRRRQRRHVAGDRQAREAWKRGIRTVQADFGGRLVADVRTGLRAGDRKRALRGLLCLLRYYPAGLASVFAPPGRWISRSAAG